MSEEEFFNRLINKIDKEFGYDVANTLQLMFIKKEKQVEQLEKEINRLNNIIEELEKYCNEEIIDYDKAIDSKILSEIDRDRYEAEKVCFLDMLDKLKALKENK